MIRCIGFFLVVFFLTLGTAQAAEPVGKKGLGSPPSAGQESKEQGAYIIADEPEVIITGWYGGGGSYSRSVRLTANSEEVLKVLFLPSDLKRQIDGKIIDRQVITADADIQLSPFIPKNIKITVNGIEEPGVYQGQVQFRPQGEAQGETLPLTVIVKAPQPLTPLPGTEQLKLHLSYPGWFSRLLLPAAETVNHRVLQFKNPFQLPVRLEMAEFVLNGEAGNQLISSKHLKVENSVRAPTDSIVDLTLTWGPTFIPPDKYTGTIYLKFDGAKEPLPLTVTELTMRYGPARALLLLLIGIPIGIFLPYMKTTGLALAKFERDLDALQDRVNQTAPVDRDILQPMLNSEESQVSAKTKKPEDADRELQSISERLSFLVRVEAIEQKLPAQVTEDILDKIKNIRDAFKQKNDAEGRRAFDQLEALLATHPAASRTFAIVRSEVPPDAAPIPPPTGIKKLLKKIGEIGPFFIKWVLPATYYLLAMVILTGVGLLTLYLKNATFGASPLADYAGLVIWGLGSNVASFNIQAVLPSGRS